VVDTHAHLSVCDPEDAELVAAAVGAGVSRILTVGMDEAGNATAIEAAEAHAGVFASVGRHPNQATGFDDADAERIEALAGHPMVRAIGETGLDYYRDVAPRDDQRRAFSAQLEIARRADLPVIIHMRESVEDCFALLAAEADDIDVVLHCFSAGPERVPEAAARGWYCSFAGNVTYPKAAELQDAASLVPEELLLVETDSPFLAPQPVRGKPNEPANVVATAEALADLRGIGYEELDALVSANAARAFGW
jgi:TatD DNase family protein